MVGTLTASIRGVEDFEEHYLEAGRLEGQRKEYQKRREIEEAKREIREAPRIVEMARRYPLVKLTQQEYDNIPKAGDFTIEWLRNEAPFGFKFICRKSEAVKRLAPNLITLGEVVEPDNAICEQIGAPMGYAHSRFVNRYRVKIVA